MTEKTLNFITSSLLVLFFSSASVASDLSAFLKGGASSFYPATTRTQAPGEFAKKNKGKVILINFWATWCAPCRAEMSDLSDLQKKLAKKGLVVIPVSQDKSMEEVSDFYAENEISLPKHLDPDGVLKKAFGATGLPMTYILDRQGNILGDIQGVVNWSDPDVLALLEHFLKS